MGSLVQAHPEAQKREVPDWHFPSSLSLYNPNRTLEGQRILLLQSTRPQPFLQKLRVQRIAIGKISKRPTNIKKEHTYLATGERIAHEWDGP